MAERERPSPSIHKMDMHTFLLNLFSNKACLIEKTREPAALKPLLKQSKDPNLKEKSYWLRYAVDCMCALNDDRVSPLNHASEHTHNVLELFMFFIANSAAPRTATVAAQTYSRLGGFADVLPLVHRLKKEVGLKGCGKIFSGILEFMVTR